MGATRNGSHPSEYPRGSGEFARDLRRAQGGDQDALGRLLTHLEARFRRFPDRRLGATLRARVGRSDILQEAYFEVIRRLPEFKGVDESGFYSWVATILENAVRQQGRYHAARKRRGPERTSEKNAVAQALGRRTPTPSSELAHAEDLILVARALDGLKDDYRQVIQLSVLEELPFAEVAETKGRSEPAARMLLSRARAALALAIERLEDSEDCAAGRPGVLRTRWPRSRIHRGPR